MADPVALKAVRVRSAPQPGLVKLLEDLMAMAKEGKLQGVAVACVYANDLEPGGEVGEGWSMAPYTTYAMSNSILRLHTKWGRYLLERSGD